VVSLGGPPTDTSTALADLGELVGMDGVIQPENGWSSTAQRPTRAALAYAERNPVPVRLVRRDALRA